MRFTLEGVDGPGTKKRMMHYCMGSDSAPDCIAAIRGLLADDPDLAEVLPCNETRFT